MSQGPPGTRLGDYQLLRQLGQGGMGAVHEAWSPRLGRKVAIKLLDGLPGLDPELRARFEREARAVAALKHPGVVGVHDLVVEPQRAWLVLELVEGEDLEARLARDGPLPPTEAARLTLQVARALAHAHALGVLHRDLKPANVLVDGDGQARVADFGLARLQGAARLTASGAVLGTPGYMAPEQALGEQAQIDARCDVYGLGALLFALLTGRPPFQRSGVVPLLEAVVNEPAPRPGQLRPGVPAALDAVCARCLAKRPELRYPSAEALADELERFLSGAPARRAGRGAWVIAGASLAGLALAAPLLLAERPSTSTPPPAPDPPPTPTPLATDPSARAPAEEPAPASSPQRHLSPEALARLAERLAESSRGGPDETGRLVEVWAELQEVAGAEAAALRARSEWALRWALFVQAGAREFVGLHQDDISCCAFSPDGKLLASGGEANVIQVVSVPDGARVATLKGHDHQVVSCAFRPDGQLVSVDRQREVRRWDPQRGWRPFELLAALTRDDRALRSAMVTLSSDGGSVALRGREGGIRVWVLDHPGFPPAEISAEEAGAPEALAFGPGGRTLACAGRAGVSVWQLEPPRLLHRFELPPRRFTEVSSSAGVVAALDARGNPAALWLEHPELGPLLPKEPGRLTGVDAVLALPWHGLVLVAPRENLELWRVGPDGLSRLGGLALAHLGEIQGLAASPDGTWLASGGDDLVVRLWRLDLLVKPLPPPPEAGTEPRDWVARALELPQAR